MMYLIPCNDTYDTIIPKNVVILQDKIKYEYSISDEFILKHSNKNINSLNLYGGKKTQKTNKYSITPRKMCKRASINIPLYVKVRRNNKIIRNKAKIVS